MSGWRRTSTAALFVGSALLVPGAAAQDRGAASSSKAPTFGTPDRLECDGVFLGATRLYPSPVIQDMNGDGLADLVLGDLWGRLTVSLRSASDATPSFGPETPITASDGSELKFDNW